MFELETVSPLTTPSSQPATGSHPKLMGKERYSWISKNAYYYEDLNRLFRFHVEKGRSVLEIGFGVGGALKACAPAKGLGLDFSEEVCAQARVKFPGFSFKTWAGDGP